MWLIVLSLDFQLSPLVVSPSSQRWNYVGEKWPMNFAWNARLPRSIQESFTCRKSTTWDRRFYFPSEGRRAEDFFALKNPTASAGFEPGRNGTDPKQDISYDKFWTNSSRTYFCPSLYLTLQSHRGSNCNYCPLRRGLKIIVPFHELTILQCTEIDST